MKSILVIGSLNMDFAFGVPHAPVPGETIIANDLLFSCGGKGANQAYAAARLGGRVAMLGAVGQDTYGDKLLENLRSVGADTACIDRRTDVSTGMAMIMVDADGENSIVVAAGANGSVTSAYIEANRALIAQSDIVILQLEIPVDTVLYAARLAKALGKTVILDPAPARGDLPEALFACVDIIKPNETEAAILLGKREADPAAAARALHARGVQWALVTLGGEGALLCSPDGALTRFAACKVKAVDTTAAGDSFTAALAVSLARGEDIAQAVRFAARVSAIVVTRHGAQSSIPTLAEVLASPVRPADEQ